MDNVKREVSTRKQIWKRPIEFMTTRYKLLAQKRAERTHRADEIRDQLQDVGLHGFDLMKPETFYIAKVLHPDEKIRAAICGHIEGGGTALLVITDSRVIYLNQTPLLTAIEEIGYGVVEAVGMDIGQFSARIHLLTGVGNFELHNVNLDAASTFIGVAEKLVVANR